MEAAFVGVDYPCPRITQDQGHDCPTLEAAAAVLAPAGAFPVMTHARRVEPACAAETASIPEPRT